MASLTGQQIQNSYQGLLKTEGNGALPQGKTNVTDGEGNNTGLFFWKQYSTMGITNNGQPTVSPFFDVNNTNFNVANSPMGGSGATTLIFSDVNGNNTFSIQQNRFGGVTYFNNKEGQPHIFDGWNNNSPIVMDSFGNSNNSNNWYTGYQRSLDGASYDSGTGDLTLSRTDDTDVVVNIPSGGGGGGNPIYNLSQTRQIWSDFLGNPVYKTTHATTGYGTVGYGITASNEFMAIPFTETTGRNITQFQFGVTTGQAGATVDIYLYKAYVKNITQGGVNHDVLDAEYVGIIAEGVDCSTSGEKVVSGIAVNLPATEDSTYFFVYRMNNGTGAFLTQWSNNVQLNPNNSLQVASGTAYRIICWQSGGQSGTMPTYLELGNMSGSTGSGLIRSLYIID